MTTIRDIAKKLNLSISTVSKGLNGASDISEETRRLVIDTALKMGYAPPQYAHKLTGENLRFH